MASEKYNYNYFICGIDCHQYLHKLLNHPRTSTGYGILLLFTEK